MLYYVCVLYKIWHMHLCTTYTFKIPRTACKTSHCSSVGVDQIFIELTSLEGATGIEYIHYYLYSCILCFREDKLCTALPFPYHLSFIYSNNCLSAFYTIFKLVGSLSKPPLNYQHWLFSCNERKFNNIHLGDIIYKVLRLYLLTVYRDKLLHKFIELCS